MYHFLFLNFGVTYQQKRGAISETNSFFVAFVGTFLRQCCWATGRERCRQLVLNTEKTGHRVPQKMQMELRALEKRLGL